jgi:DNA-binding MarR family transcriptional regulator
MNKSIELLIAFDEYQQKYADAALQDFCRYYLAKSSKTVEPKTGSSRGLLLKIIGRIASAFSLYHRAAMDKTELPSPEGFYYLNGLTVLGEVRKTELINYLLVEYTTGMEAINKLLSDRLIVERPDENDKRAKLISLTKKGKTVLSDCYSYSTKAGQIIFGDLDENDLQLCIQLLKGVEEKHSKLAIELKNQDFEKMFKKAVQLK